MKHLLSLLLVTLLFFSCADKPREKENTTKNPFYTAAITYRGEERSDSAFLYFNKSKDWFLQAKDSLGAGKCLLNMAAISISRGDYFGGQELGLQALNYLDGTKEKHLPYVRANLNELGIASFELKNYAQAMSFYRQSLTYTSDSAEVLVLRNNIANAYRKEHDFKKALSIYEGILKQDLDTEETVRVRANFAFTKWLQDPQYRAAPELLKALRNWKKEGNFLGQNLSYSNLSDYYMRSKPDSAFFYASNMYAVARRNGSPDDQLDALQKLIRSGAPQAAKEYFSTYQRLSDSIQAARNAAKNQFALIRYETEKHKADNLKLQKDNAEKKYDIVKRNIALGVVILVVIFGSISARLWYRKRKQRLELEKRNAVQESQIKLSKKVHDVVANGLYRIMTEVEHTPEIDKEQLLDKIEWMYNRSRNISYEKLPFTDRDFHETLVELITSFANDNTKVLMVGNNDGLWKNVGSGAREEIQHILQELMVNMKKHSRARNVAIKFVKQGHAIHLHYTDDGIGFPEEIKYGNGLTNTETRIKSINGQVTFDTGTENGAKIRISFPAT